jgi:SPP1 gp7 family putative phage head morphogenesis protein
MMDLLLDAFKLPPAQAIAFLRSKGMVVSWNWFDTWREANSQAFTVAKVMRLDILQDIRGMVDKAVAEGITFQQFKKELTPMLKAKGWWGEQEIDGAKVQLGSPRRLQTIFDNNVQSAYNAGRYKQQMEVIEQRPYWQYIAVLDSQTTTRCRGLHQQVFRADDPVWDTIYPPNHFGCRARVRTVSQPQLERDRLRVSSAEIVSREFEIGGGENRRMVPVRGVKTTNAEGQPILYFPDAGWDYNPGKAAWKPDLSKYDGDIAAGAAQDKP